MAQWDRVLPAADIVDMMLENHIMLPNSQTEPFTTAETEEEREKAALKILKIHYNVDSVQELFIRSPKYPNNIGFGDDLIQLEDWHRIYPPTSEEFGSMYKEIHKAYRPDGQ